MRTIVLLVLAGCGFDKLPKLILDAPNHDATAVDAPAVPEGPHTHYIANELHVPTTNTQARAFGLDLNNDGTVDNQLGMVFSTLSGMGFAIQDANDKAVAEGQNVLLVDFQSKDFANAPAAALTTYLGDPSTVSPAACNSSEVYDVPTKTGCQHHLTGNASVTIDPGSPLDAPLVGPLANSIYTGGPGMLSLEVVVVGGPIRVDLIGARVKSTGLIATVPPASTADTVVLGGAVTMDDVDNKFIPALQAQFVPIIQRDCTDLTAPPGCGCTTNTDGKTLIGLFDANQDCTVTIDEIKTNSLIVSLLAPDLVIDGKMALSFGVLLSVVNATFTVPGQ